MGRDFNNVNLYLPIQAIHWCQKWEVREPEGTFYPIDLGPCKNELDVIVSKLKVSKAEAMREAIRHYAEYVRGLEVVKYRKITKRRAKAEIQKYLKKKEVAYASDIADDLRIDYELVVESLRELWEGGEVEVAE